MADRTLVSFDYAIKNILRSKSDFVILSGFISELIGQKVIVTDILESEVNTDQRSGKTNRLDLKAKLSDGEIAVFEIQFSDVIDFVGKIIYDACKAVVEQLAAGDKYDINKVYSINIAYFNVGAKRDYVFTARMSERLDYLKMTPAQRRGYEEYLNNRTSIDTGFETAFDKGRAKEREKWQAVVAKKDAALAAAFAEIERLKNANAK